VSPDDFTAFAALEREGWARVAPDYEDTFGRCTSLAIPALLDLARLAPGARMLDVACGPGYAAAAAVARGARASGLDLSSGMIERARAACPAGEFKVGDAQALPWNDSEFDAVVSNFGIQHLPDPDRGLAEMFRVLRSGGRLAFSVWERAELSPGQRLLDQAIERHGEQAGEMPAAPAAQRFAAPDEARRTLAAVGFLTVDSTPIDVRLLAPDPGAVFDMFHRGTVRLGARLRFQTPAALERIRSAFTESLAPWRTAGGVAVPLRAVLTSAVKP